ncbi:MAG: hypothetical protein ABSF36_08705, partial [Candidatus Methanomethylicaceae archaeon]
GRFTQGFSYLLLQALFGLNCGNSIMVGVAINLTHSPLMQVSAQFRNNLTQVPNVIVAEWQRSMLCLYFLSALLIYLNQLIMEIGKGHTNVHK